jgi:hypothetical protein
MFNQFNLRSNEDFQVSASFAGSKDDFTAGLIPLPSDSTIASNETWSRFLVVKPAHPQHPN